MWKDVPVLYSLKAGRKDLTKRPKILSPTTTVFKKLLQLTLFSCAYSTFSHYDDFIVCDNLFKELLMVPQRLLSKQLKPVKETLQEKQITKRETYCENIPPVLYINQYIQLWIYSNMSPTVHMHKLLFDSNSFS